jgi:hypothetical protein
MKEFADQTALRAIAARAARDRAFRKQLLENPRAAVTQVLGVPVPESLRLKFVEKDPQVDVMIVLPDLILEEGELTEEDVAGVAGGTDWGCQDVSTA